jgi:hypothetical protein
MIVLMDVRIAGTIHLNNFIQSRPDCPCHQSREMASGGLILLYADAVSEIVQDFHHRKKRRISCGGKRLIQTSPVKVKLARDLGHSF